MNAKWKMNSWSECDDPPKRYGMAMGDSRDGVELTNLDQPLFDGAEATKRDLVDYLDLVRDRILPVLRGRPLSVMRVRPGQAPFMQNSSPKLSLFGDDRC